MKSWGRAMTMYEKKVGTKYTKRCIGQIGCCSCQSVVNLINKKWRKNGIKDVVRWIRPLRFGFSRHYRDVIC